jgi:flavin reductase (DIM6/NTAB) family NADH-FMN oxidoreductase RutF/rubredoxin
MKRVLSPHNIKQQKTHKIRKCQEMNHKALHKISYGLYVITSGKKGNCNGQIANTVFQATSEPPTIAVCINKKNFTYEFIQESKVFAVSVLSKSTPLEFIGNFGFKCGRDTDKFKGINYKIGRTGAPIVLDHTIAYLDAKVIKEFDGGTHTIFIGEVVDAEILTDEEPMTYAYYHKIKKGTTPKAAPTYIKEENRRESKMAKYRCTICGYIYDPEEGDTESGIPSGTPFEELPDDWVCPICGATKDQFEIVE